MFHIFGPRYLSALKPQFLFSLIITESQFLSEGYIGHSSILKVHALLEQLDFFVLYSSVANILRFLT